MKLTRISVRLVLLAGYCLTVGPALAADTAPPRLVLQITVDQLRGDLPHRYMNRFGDGGFRYLWEHGIVYTDAHHSHANTETIVGHATLATGATPAVHGMIGNVWVDRQTGSTVYNIEDGRYQLLTPGADVDEETEIDPTQRAARSEGRSPAAMLVSTFSDELSSYTGGKAKVFAVSVKDRGAVAMAGHSGKAFWFSKASGQFVSSSYYYSRYPAWVESWNAAKPAGRYAEAQWTLLHEADTYLFGSSDDRPWETDLAGFSRTFPHPWGDGASRYFPTLLTLSPAGDELTADFAKALIENEELGKDAVPDYLGVSFSSTDYVGHVFGPSSLEAEDNLLRLDKTIADLLGFVDRQVGLKNTLIVLAADHGAPDTPGYSKSLGVPGGYVDTDAWDSESAIARVKADFGIEGPLVQKYQHPYVYLSPEVNSRSATERLAIERAVVEEINRFPEVALAVSSRALEFDNLPESPLMRAVRNNFNRQRSGDVFVVFKPNWFINDFDGLTVASTHGSPWRYDTFVPVVFAGHGITGQKIHRRVETVDVARTLAAYLGTKPPSGATGRVLPEVVSNR